MLRGLRLRIIVLITALIVASVIASITASNTAYAAPTELVHQQQQLDYRGYTFTVMVPKGLRLELLNDTLEQPRMMVFGGAGELLIGSRSGAIYRVRPPYRTAEELIRLSAYPHSLAMRQTGSGAELLIARTDGVYTVPYRADQQALDAAELSLLAALPAGRGHNTRSITIGPDGRIYVSLGIAGNCSDQYLGDAHRYPFTDQRGGVVVLDANSHTWQPFAAGLRNPVGIAWRVSSGELYASNNGPDHWGYDTPLEVFAKLSADSFHGMPWYQHIEGELRRDRCIDSTPPRPASDVTLPRARFPARSAPLGVSFVPQGALLPALSNDAVVALHGSWATAPDGDGSGDPASRRPPALVAVRFDNDQAVRVDTLVSGFQLADGRRWARPAGVTIGPDGALYFSSDGGINGLFRLLAEKS